MQDTKPVINLAELEFREQQHGTRFAARHGAIARHIGARQLGYRLTVVPPGKSAWPFHRHHANEEMLFILEGEGTLRFGQERYPLRSGDVVALPAGGPAHEVTNSGTGELRYLAVSTMREPEVVEYPDSGKFAAFAGAAPGGDGTKRTFEAVAPLKATVDYWEGELWN